MRDLTKRIFWASIASTLVMLLFGILLFIFPETVIKSVAIAMGVIFIMIGVIPIINYFRFRATGFTTTFSFLLGIFCIVAGLILLMNENILGTIIPILTGVWMIINSINRISISMDLRDDKITFWVITFIYAILTLVAGVLLILDPVNGGKLVTKTIGIIICVYSTLDVIDLILIRIKAKKVVKEVKKIIEEP